MRGKGQNHVKFANVLNGWSLSTTITDNSTTISIPEDGSDDTILIASLTAVGAVILILCIALSVFMYIRGKRRKIVGRYNPAYLGTIHILRNLF